MPLFRQQYRPTERIKQLPAPPLITPGADFSFFDHFPGAALDARWSTSTTGSGAITVTDSYAQSNLPADADAALFYYNTKLDKTKSQLWQIAVSHHSSSTNLDVLQIWNKATAPAIDTFANIDGNWRIRVGRSTSGTTGLAFHKYDSGHTRTTWTGYTTNAWQTPSTLAIPEMAVDDYYVLGFEIDGPNSRWRLMAWHRDAPSSSFTQDQGFKLFALTDWVLWSSMEATNDLWLVLGEPLTDFQAGTIRYEYVRAVGTENKIHAWCNGNGPGNDYSLIKHHWSYDGYTFVPQDRDTIAVTVGTAGAWDDSKAKDRTVVKDGDTYYMVYSAEKAATGLWELGLATAASPNGPWTKHSGNPILTSTGAGTSEEFLWTPYLIKDEAETDPDKRWKLFYDGIDVSPIAHTIRLATAATPTGTWTKQGIALNVGGGGAIDELGCSNPVVFRNAGIWEVWFTALEAGGGPRWSVCRATTTDLNSLPYTKDAANNPYIPRDQDARQALTANLDGRTASMTDTTGFEVDQYVSARDSGGGGAAHLQWGYSRVRKVNTNTSLELYHGLSGFTTANSAAIRGMNGGSITVHHIEFRNGRYEFYCTLFDIFRSDATLAGDFSETTGLCYSAGLTDKPKIWDWINSPNISQTPWDHRDSAENISIARPPILADAVTEDFPAGYGQNPDVPHISMAAR